MKTGGGQASMMIKKTLKNIWDEFVYGGHCLAAYLPTHLTLNVVNGKLSFGDWQRIFCIELDHARDRKVQIQVLGE